jgi:hypothetical protein
VGVTGGELICCGGGVGCAGDGEGEATTADGVIGAGVLAAEIEFCPRARANNSATCDLMASLSCSAFGEMNW